MVSKSSPSPPVAPEFDLSFAVDFDPTQGSVSRAFAATHDFIVVCEQLDHELARCLDPSVRSHLTIGDIEASSLKTFLVQVIRGADDATIRREGWKAFVRSFLVEAKHLILRHVDDHEGEWAPRRMMDDINQIALREQVRQLPYYKPPKLKKIMEAVGAYHRMKTQLEEDDTAYMESTYGRHIVNLSVSMDADGLLALATATKRESVAPLLLVVKKPDFLGDSQWELRHGGRIIMAKIEDGDWLQGFQQREVPLQPGDALDCVVRVINAYGYDNELLATKYFVQSVRGVIHQEASPDPLPLIH